MTITLTQNKKNKEHRATLIGIKTLIFESFAQHIYPMINHKKKKKFRVDEQKSRGIIICIHTYFSLWTCTYLPISRVQFFFLFFFIFSLLWYVLEKKSVTFLFFFFLTSYWLFELFFFYPTLHVILIFTDIIVFCIIYYPYIRQLSLIRIMKN